MRHEVGLLVPVLLAGGCSLIYNPSNIDKPAADARMIDMGEVAIDVEIRADAMPLDVTIMDVFPAAINEGTGTGNSRPAVVVIKGHNFVNDPTYNLSVTLSAQTAATLTSFEASENGDYIALAITAPIDTACGETTSVPVGVTVTQSDGAGGMVTAPGDHGFSVTCLNELDAAPASANDLKSIYSRVMIAGAVDLGAAAKGAIIRSASSISIGGSFDASATGTQAGPGGGTGGGPNLVGSGLRPGGGTAAAGAGGGGAGFLTVGTAGGTGTVGGAGGTAGGTTGDAWLSKFSTSASSGGGGGGNGLGVAGAGGGGGGTVELTAPGDISVGAITANGAAGGTGNGGEGGAGTGGVVLIRSGGTLVLPSIAVTKGAKTGNGGASADGRIRVDAAKGTYPSGGTACSNPVDPASTSCNATIGPMFVDLPTKTTVQTQSVTLRGLANDSSATLRVFDKLGEPVQPTPAAPVFGLSGNATAMPTLKAGYNKICVWVAGGTPTIDESTNCQEIAYLPL